MDLEEKLWSTRSGQDPRCLGSFQFWAEMGALTYDLKLDTGLAHDLLSPGVGDVADEDFPIIPGAGHEAKLRAAHGAAASRCAGARGSSEGPIQAMWGRVSEQVLGVQHVTFTMVLAHSILGIPSSQVAWMLGPSVGERGGHKREGIDLWWHWGPDPGHWLGDGVDLGHIQAVLYPAWRPRGG